MCLVFCFVLVTCNHFINLAGPGSQNVASHSTNFSRAGQVEADLLVASVLTSVAFVVLVDLKFLEHLEGEPCRMHHSQFRTPAVWWCIQVFKSKMKVQNPETGNPGSRSLSAGVSHQLESRIQDPGSRSLPAGVPYQFGLSVVSLKSEKLSRRHRDRDRDRIVLKSSKHELKATKSSMSKCPRGNTRAFAGGRAE